MLLNRYLKIFSTQERLSRSVEDHLLLSCRQQKESGCLKQAHYDRDLPGSIKVGREANADLECLDPDGTDRKKRLFLDTHRSQLQAHEYLFGTAPSKDIPFAPEMLLFVRIYAE